MQITIDLSTVFEYVGLLVCVGVPLLLVTVFLLVLTAKNAEKY